MNPVEAKGYLSHYRESPFREYQEEAIEYILKSEKKVCILSAATGSGKSLVGLTAGVAFGSLTYVVHSKALQNQICFDFPESKHLFGRANYECKANPDLNCDECYSTQQSFCLHKKTDCEYEARKREVLASPLKVLNTDYYLNECTYVGRFSHAPFVIIDEADVLESSLINFTSLMFTKYALARLGLCERADKLHKTSKFKEKLIDEWLEFGHQAQYRVTRVIDKLTNQIAINGSKDVTEEQSKMIKEKIRVVRLQEKIQLFLNNVTSEWILEDKNDRLTWRPLWMTPELSNEFFFRHAKRFILMSASFLPVKIEAKRLGLDLDDVDFKEIPSTFPPENRRVVVHPVGNLVSKEMATEVPKVIDEVKIILSNHQNERGLIHAVSHKLAREVYESVDSPRMMIHDSTNRQEVLDEFLASTTNAVLISPSLDRGISLDYDKARFQIILKMPWLSMGNRVVQERVYGSGIGQLWYQATAMLSILQMCGRAVRSKDDTAITYILDEQFHRILSKKPLLLPFWFREALEFE